MSKQHIIGLVILLVLLVIPYDSRSGDKKKDKVTPEGITATTRIVDYNVVDWGISGSHTFTTGSNAEGIQWIEVRDQDGKIIAQMDRKRIEALASHPNQLLSTTAASLLTKLSGRNELTKASRPNSQKNVQSVQAGCIGTYAWPLQTIWNSSVTVNQTIHQ